MIDLERVIISYDDDNKPRFVYSMSEYAAPLKPPHCVWQYFEWDKPLTGLKLLQEKVDAYTKEMEGFKLKPLKQAQREESVDLNSYEEQKDLRTKALELAILSWGESVRAATATNIITFAEAFYTYITKGE